ncbi:hypothetical protein AX15_006997 [Amanita polypyramis BW_CC]|nr:hypothetical protein AX15_006997 [Amanita polypyramis BW_CC]
MLRLTIIVAATKTNGIGRNSGLPWRLAKEMKYFARATSNAPEGAINTVVMGRNTWESIPKKFRPLPNRMNVVISRNKDYDLGVPQDVPAYLEHDFTSVFARIQNTELQVHRTFIIGGASLYVDTLAFSLTSPAFVDRILITRILEPEFECDVFMPDFIKDDQRWQRASHEQLKAWVGFDVPEGIQEENGVKYEFQMWTRDV